MNQLLLKRYNYFIKGIIIKFKIDLYIKFKFHAT